VLLGVVLFLNALIAVLRYWRERSEYSERPCVAPHSNHTKSAPTAAQPVMEVSS
jgi:hypothetical protein